MTIIEELDSLRSGVLDAIAKAQDTSALEDIRVAALGKSGTLTAYLRSMGSVPKEQKAEVGRAVNEAREAGHWTLQKRSLLPKSWLPPSPLMRWMSPCQAGPSR